LPGQAAQVGRNKVADTEYALEAYGIGKRFSDFWAVREVDLKVRRGSIHALIGPNGAGKTTCFNLLTKTLQPSTGKIILNGEDISGLRASDIARKGMARSFQISATFTDLTALENVRVALQSNHGSSWRFWSPIRSIYSLNQRAEELLEEVGLAEARDLKASELSYGKKRALEIATTVALEPEVMLLDEPTAGMGHEDIEPITALIRKVSAGRTIVIVEHNLPVISTLSDRITVLQAGQVLMEGNYAEVSSDERVIAAYMGGVDDVA
jgi:branched-chain amino acid transport system ATP-binding protein